MAKMLMRRPLTVMVAIFVALIGWTGAGFAGEGVIPAEIWRKAQTTGSVRVIVQLAVATQPEGALSSPQVVLAQRQAIVVVQNELLAELAGTSHRVTRQFNIIPFIALEAGLDGLAAMERSARVVRVTEDRLAAPSLPRSVPLVEADQAWAAGFDGTGWTVAVLDTGVDKGHPFLAGKVVAEACFSGNSNCPDGSTTQIGSPAGVPCTYAAEGCKHGTHVAGIAAGNGDSFSGVGKGASLISIQVFSRFTGSDCAGQGEDPCARSYESDEMAALIHAFDLRDTLRIASVNMSLGGGLFVNQASCDAANPGMKAAIDNLRSVGIATVASSGNNQFVAGLNSPACISTAISVGATTKNDSIWDFSNSAYFLSLLAPGDGIFSSIPRGGVDLFGLMSGTSMAAPHVAGAWAILKERSPAATVPKVLSALKCTGLKISDPRTDPPNRLTTPRIRIFQALNALVSAPIVQTINVPGNPPAQTAPAGINDIGQIVGYFSRVGIAGTHGFLGNTDGTFTTFDVLGASDTFATGINNIGQIVGQFDVDVAGFSSFHGFLRNADGTLTTFDVPGFIGTTSASGINDTGQIVGCAGCAGGSHGFLRNTDGTFTTFDVPGASYTQASGINNAGQIVGRFGDPTFSSHGFLRNADGTFTTFDVPGASYTQASGINNAGQIVGWFADSKGDPHGFLLSEGSFTTTIDFSVGAPDSEACGINTIGEIVGIFFDPNSVRAGGFFLCGAELPAP